MIVQQAVDILHHLYTLEFQATTFFTVSGILYVCPTTHIRKYIRLSYDVARDVVRIPYVLYLYA